MHVAQVKNGRLTLDEPTDLPEGTVVPLEIADDWDELDDEERAALHESIREGIEDMEAGRTVDAKTAIAELRSVELGKLYRVFADPRECCVQV